MLNDPVPGLRPLFNRSKQTQKVTIAVLPGEELYVTEAVARQLPVEFTPVGDDSKERGVAARAAAARASEAQEGLPLDDDAADTEARPAKARKKA